MSEIDNTDRQIVDLLIEDGRMPCAEVARRIGGVTERVVRYRLERMIAGGLVRVGVIPNPRAFGYSVIADVFIEAEAGQIAAVAEQLRDFECVSYVACSTGERDVSVQIVAHDNSELYAFVTEVIAMIPGVRKTTTSIVPVVLKDVYQWRIPRAPEPADIADPGKANGNRARMETSASKEAFR
jgi:Lrp/AsnC family transcriptional regulator for asnA, asnC and gidA